MRTKTVTLPAEISAAELAATLNNERGSRGQGLYPVVDIEGLMIGVVTRRDIDQLGTSDKSLAKLVRREPVVAFADEPLRIVANRMAETGLTRFPVVDPDEPRRVVSIVTLRDLLHARSRALTEERERERTIKVRSIVRLPTRREPAGG
jgi:CIC family chloride channel protein